MSTTKEKSSTRIVIGPVRLSYAHIWEPTAIEEGKEKKYSTSLIIPKSDKATVAKINAAIEAATQEGLEKHWKGKLPAKFWNPLRDGDDEKADDEAYQGAYFLSAKSKAKPGVVDTSRNEILDKDQVYSGCYCMVSINFFPFDNKIRGVAAGLGNIMKLKDGDPLGGGKVSAEEDFAGVEVEDDLL